MNDYAYFFAAYTVLWAFLAWYMFSLSKKQRLLRDEIRILKNRARVQE
jgi:CcmD family protein